MNNKDFNDVDFNDVFSRAKENTVYSHAMVWIKEVLRNETKTDNEQFILIQKIVNETQKHL